MTQIEARRQPAEWAAHEAVWIGWPSARDLWGDYLGPARAEVEDFIRAIVFPGAGISGDDIHGERVRMLVNGQDAMSAAQLMRSKLPSPEMVELIAAPIGDIWLRDTGPIFTKTLSGELVATSFDFNGWGGKYELPRDPEIAALIASQAGVRLREFPDFVAEGGALEVDGEGTVITTRQCLLNKNRNPSMSERDVEAVLRSAIGAEKVIWLEEGLIGDHTDGHVDNLVRFFAPGKVICMHPFGSDDPNAKILNDIETRLRASTDSAGRSLEVVTIASPGRVEIDAAPVAASHMNFYISNHAVIMPCYKGVGVSEDASSQAVQTLQSLNIREHVYAIDSSHILTGGGSFHCISQQQPAISSQT